MTKTRAITAAIAFAAGFTLAGAAEAGKCAHGCSPQKDHHMKIEIHTVRHSSQRYDTVGDWLVLKDGTMQAPAQPLERLEVTVSKMRDGRYEFLVGLHEMVEAYLCTVRGISEASVTAFDTGPGKDLEEPGDSPAAPYHKEHVFATRIERLMADELGVDWAAYEAEIASKLRSQD